MTSVAVREADLRGGTLMSGGSGDAARSERFGSAANAHAVANARQRVCAAACGRWAMPNQSMSTHADAIPATARTRAFDDAASTIAGISSITKSCS